MGERSGGVRVSGPDAGEREETSRFFPTAFSSFLAASVLGKTWFLLQETVSSHFVLFPH
jgi:hypothetical protein